MHVFFQILKKKFFFLNIQDQKFLTLDWKSFLQIMVLLFVEIMLLSELTTTNSKITKIGIFWERFTVHVSEFPQPKISNKKMFWYLFSSKASLFHGNPLHLDDYTWRIIRRFRYILGIRMWKVSAKQLNKIFRIKTFLTVGWTHFLYRKVLLFERIVLCPDK